jgi:hypothetical protein
MQQPSSRQVQISSHRQQRIAAALQQTKADIESQSAVAAAVQAELQRRAQERASKQGAVRAQVMTLAQEQDAALADAAALRATLGVAGQGEAHGLSTFKFSGHCSWQQQQQQQQQPAKAWYPCTCPCPLAAAVATDAEVSQLQAKLQQQVLLAAELQERLESLQSDLAAARKQQERAVATAAAAADQLDRVFLDK